MSPGTAAYFWSDHTFRFAQGFRFQGSSMMFGKPRPVSAKAAAPAATPEIACRKAVR